MRRRHLKITNYISTLALVCAVSAPLPAFCADAKESGYVSSQATDNGARLTFSWNAKAKVAFKPEVKDKKIYLHFDSPVSLDWGNALTNLQPYLKEVQTADNGKTVVLTMTSASKARKFLTYGKNGIDFSKNGIELSELPAGKQPITTMDAPQEEDLSELPPPAPEKPVMSKKAQQKLAADRHKANRLKKEKQRKLVKIIPPTPAATIPVAAEESDLAKLSPAAGESGQAEQAPPAAPASSPTVEAVLEPAPPAPAAATEPAAAETVKTEPTKKEPEAKQEPVETGETIALPFLKDDPFAIFTRGKTLWIAADESTHMTLDSFKALNKSLKYPVTEVATKEGKVITIEMDKAFAPSFQKPAEGKLELALSSAQATPAERLVPVLAQQDKKSLITFTAEKAGKLITATDPVSGETLQILPVPILGNGLATERKFVEFSLLPTAQGVVVQPVADTLSVAYDKNILEISTPAGLTVSEELRKELEDAQSEVASEKIPPVFFPYVAWKLDDEKKFVSTQLKLTHTIYSGTAEEANNARLRLLGLFLAEGLFAEANGMANDILRTSYKFYVEHKVAAMRGASNFFRQRFAEAEQDFASPELEGLPETRMWLALCHEQMANVEKANETFSFKDNYEPFIRYYPPSFIQKIAVVAADKSVNRKDYDAATAIFTTLQKENIDEPIKKYIDFMRAKILAETGNEDEAAKIWERQTTDIADRLIRARAEFSLVNMYLKEEKIPVEDAAKRLEKLRIVWRGDDLELNVLTLLGNLYVEQKDYARALRAWRDIVVYYSDIPEAITTARKMEEVFVKLYNKNVADDMSPLSALSLFYEFRDLVPTGNDGDMMIRNLAERLVKIDLLDRASQLLLHQVRNRLQGAERSRVGARLAEIYLMNRQPKQALETLKTTGYGDLTPDIQLARIRLTAQALAQQGQLEKAIDVLSSDTSPDGNLLRLTVYWTNWDWPNVVTMAEEILSNRNDPSAILTLQESEVLLKLATAYVYEHDSGQIQYLRDYFTPLLKGNPNKESFLFITSESGSIDYTNLSNLDKDINTVKTFIDTSRKSANSKSAATTSTPAEEQPTKAVN